MAEETLDGVGGQSADGQATRPQPFVTPLTSFVGRTQAIDEIAGLLDQYRMVTLTGSGGCGKTRLALEVAKALHPNFGDGGAFVDLAPIDSPALVPSAFAAAAGVSEAGASPLPVLLGNALADRHLLLLVDNCERVADTCAELLHQLLRHCPRLVVLATSRSPVGVEGEVTWRVPSLSLPDASSTDPVAAVHDSETGALLIDRARLARPGFDVSPMEAQAVLTICRRLDGIPLAIELAASRLRALDPADVAAGLEHRFRLLSAGSRVGPPRQRTLEASIEWSYDLLDTAERLLFQRLAVFAAGFSIDRAEAVCAEGDLQRGDVRAVLAELVDKSLVHVEDRVDGARYRLLETVREYATMRLEESGEEPAFRLRHLDYLLDLTAELDAVIEGRELEAEIREIEPLSDDIRGAIEWTITSGRTADGLRLAANLRSFWIHRSRIQEGLAWFTALLETDQSDDLAARTRALLAAAHLCLYASDPQGQARLADEALEAARLLGDRPLERRALLFAAWAKVFLDPAEARAKFALARQAAEEGNDLRNIENASWGLGWAAATSGDLGAARQVLSEGINIARGRRSLGARYGLTMLGYADIMAGRLAEATAELAEADSMFVGDGDRFNRDRTVTWQALAAMYQGDLAEADRGFRAAIASAKNAGNPPMFAPLHFGLLQRAIGDHTGAAIWAEEARLALHQLGFPWWFDVQALVVLGDTAATTDDTAAAAKFWSQAMWVADASGNPLARTVAGLGLARGAVIDGDRDRALTLLRTALRLAIEADFGIGAIDTLEALAGVLAADGSPTARLLLAAADAERARIGYVRFPIDEPAYDAAVDSVRGILGEDTDASVVGFDEAVDLALGAGSRPARPASGWASLTPAELRVAELAAEGLTNPEIGERLFISRRTVQAHLSRVFTKLGIGNRAELATAASRRGVSG